MADPLAAFLAEPVAQLERTRPAAYVELWTIQGAARRNTLTRALVAELLAATAAVDRDPAVRAVVVTGEGDKAFCAGADLKERSGMSLEEVHAWLDSLRALMAGLEACRVPFVAALNGSAFGGGTELALACDLRVGAETAELALTEITLAIIPGAGGTQRLPRLVGLGVASELVLTGRRVGMAEAKLLGLVNRVVPAGQAVAEAVALAALIAHHGPIAVAAAKVALQQGNSLPLADGLTLERREYEKTLPTKDRLEGLAAFREKRQPVYRGE